MESTISKALAKWMLRTPQFEITITCLQAHYQATVQAALFEAHRARIGVLSLNKMDDGHQLDLEDGPRRNVRA